MIKFKEFSIRKKLWVVFISICMLSVLGMVSGITLYEKNPIIAFIVVGVVVVVFFVVCILAANTIVKSITKPLANVNMAAENMSKGNFDIQIDQNGLGEIGEVAKALGLTFDTFKNVINDVNYILGELAKGNFNVNSKCEDEYVGELKQILISTKKICDNLSGVISDIDSAAQEVVSGSDQIAESAQVLSEASIEQAGFAEELVATLSTISEQANITATNSEQASEKNTKSSEELQITVDNTKQLVDAMFDIEEKSKEISNIIKAINDIAEQTNLLSLNAAIEAARAGDAGRGFSVVADEIRKLADQSGEAAKDIVELIGKSSQSVKNGVNILDNTVESIGHVKDTSDEVSGLVNDISDAIKQQSVAISELVNGVEQLSTTIQTNSSTSEETAAASEELASQAELVKSRMNAFNLKKER